MGTTVLLLGALAMLASACITDGRWAATTPSAVGIANTFRPQFGSVSCPTATFCMGVGGGAPYESGTDLLTPVIQTWDGSVWTDRSADFPFAGPEGTSMGEVSCASATSCIATYNYWITLDILALVAHWDGTTWTNVPVDHFSSFTTTVSCAPDGTCLVAAESAATYVWDGDSIEKLDGTYAPELVSLDCVTATACWGIAGYGNESWHWDGTTWTAVPMPTPPGDPDLSPTFSASSIECATSWWCVAVGQVSVGTTPTAASALWNGRAWSYPPVPASTPSSMRSVSCVNGAECVALGATRTNEFPYFGEPITVVWDGTTWSAAPNPPGTGPLYPAVSCPPGSDLDCMAVGGSPSDPDSVLVAARYTWDRSV